MPLDDGAHSPTLMRASQPLPGDYRPGTLVDLVLDASSNPLEAAARTRRPDGAWTPVSTSVIDDRVRGVALGLRSLGFGRGDRVAIISHTRLEWAVADYGLIMAGVVSVPVYPVLPAEQIEYLLSDSGARAVFVSDQEQLDKVLAIRARLPELQTMFAFDPVDGADHGVEVVSLADLIRRGDSAADIAGSYEAHARETDPEDLATLIYTSGTTGPPKGVMLTHANFHSNVVLSARVFPIGRGDVMLSLLPLAHVFERTVGHYLARHAGITVAYAESTATVARDMVEVRPTVMAGVPRVFEKVLERAEEIAREAGGAKARIFDWARRVGELCARHEMEGESPSLALRLQAAVADRLVFSKLRARTGGRIRYFVSGGAPLPEPVARFFFAAKLPIIEGYGLTETSPILTFNPVDAVRIGSVGRPIPGTELEIAADGEILARGAQIMKGYLDRPDATAEAIDPDGWFHTGDIGEIDAGGYLRITGRKKDLIVTAYGKNIAPQPIEAAIKRDPIIAEAVVLGDGRKFPIVLVVPDIAGLRSRLGDAVADPAALVASPAARDLLERAVRAGSEGFAHYERPREVLPVTGPFTVEGGELTPTLKVKRRVVSERYREEIESLYERAERAFDAHDGAVSG